VRRRTAARLAVVIVLLARAVVARAGNEPEKGQRRVELDVLPKLALACGVPLTVSWDGASLRKHNQDIGYDQTDGGSECNEPLRYLWYACATDAGKAAVKAARVSKVVCRGVAGATGSLALAGGTITVERAFEEAKPYLRSRRQFEAALKITLKLRSDDPYPDEAWHALARQPNPVTSTTTYCLVNGDKVVFNENVHDPFCRRKQDAKLRCWKDRELVIDLEVRQGKKSGFLTQFNDKNIRRIAYRDDKPHGEERRIEDGKLTQLIWHDGGERVWDKQLYPSGKLKRYTRTLPVGQGYAEIDVKEDGRVYGLRCSPAVRDDQELRKPCGFEGAVTTSIYDGTGKVARVETWENGVIQKQAAGSSDYGSRSEVAFKDGKRQGEERVLSKDGKLASIVSWDRGVRDGKETVFAGDGKKVVKEVIWKAGEKKAVTELYLNGNPRLKETYDEPKKKRVQTFWDTGKVSRDGALVTCESARWGYLHRGWCEDGVHKSFYEDGAPQSEVTYRLGSRHGASRSWWQDGKPESVEVYADDKLTAAKRWDKDGKLMSDDEFEADGSRKLRR
jgi:antitoxin component YwqK of YwqJK toxin-antitoxin module